MRKSSVLLVLLLSGPAHAVTEYESLPLPEVRTVLSGRLCLFAHGLETAKKGTVDTEPPEVWSRMIDFTRKQLDDIKKPAMPCRDKSVRKAMMCATSVWGKTSVPLACLNGPLYGLTAVDMALTAPPDLPRD